MDIIWHGYSCFTIKTKNCTAIIDPYRKEVGVKLPPLKGEVALVSHIHDGSDNVEAIEGSPRVIDWPGEYEVKGMIIIAKKVANPLEENSKKSNQGLIFTIDIDGVKLCFLGDTGDSKDENFIESIGDVDILFLPIGGQNTINSKKAHEIAEEIEPRVVIPMYYSTSEIKSDLATVDEFLKLMGASAIEPKDKFTVSTRSELPEEKTDCVVLKPQIG